MTKSISVGAQYVTLYYGKNISHIQILVIYFFSKLKIEIANR
jgi:hypothetical protein